MPHDGKLSVALSENSLERLQIASAQRFGHGGLQYDRCLWPLSEPIRDRCLEPVTGTHKETHHITLIPGERTWRPGPGTPPCHSRIHQLGEDEILTMVMRQLRNIEPKFEERLGYSVHLDAREQHQRSRQTNEFFRGDGSFVQRALVRRQLLQQVQADELWMRSGAGSGWPWRWRCRRGCDWAAGGGHGWCGSQGCSWARWSSGTPGGAS